MITKITNLFLENKKSIIISLLTTIVLLYVEPILSFVNKKIIDSLLFLSVKFSNYYFLSVAKYSIDKNTHYESMILYLFFIVLILTMFKRIKYLEKKYSIKILDDDKEKIKKEKEIKQFLKWKLFYKFFFVFIGMYTYSMLAFNISVDSLNLKFKNNLAIISPFVENSKINNLKYKWLIMKNKNDFYEINNEIENIYLKNNLEENQNFKFKNK